MSTNNNGIDLSGKEVRHVALWAIVGLVAGLFVVGSIYSGMIFLSNTDTVSQVVKDSLVAQDQKSIGPDSFPAKDIGIDAGTPLPVKDVSDPRFAFLLMGYGGGGHDGAYLTDSMMVVIVDPSRKSLTLISLPRDAWVPISFDGQKPIYSKLNTAYAYARDSSLFPNRLQRYKGKQGAGVLTADTVSQLLGIPIPYYLALDFAGFRKAIDAVGGIDVEIPESFSAEYPANDDPSIDDSWTVVRFRKGVEHMNGERAIQYARAREAIDNISEGSDFARSRRQRAIIEAFKTRLFQPDGLVHLPQLLAVAATHVDTNYSLPSVAQLTQLAMDWKNVKFFQAALTNSNYLVEATGPEGAYILVPDAPGQSWAPIQAVIKRLWDTPELGVAMMETEVVVENCTGMAGAASRLSDALKRLGYRVGTPTTGPTRADSQAVDRTDGAGAQLLDRLGSDLGIKWSQIVREQSRQGGIVLRIGSGDAALSNLSVPTMSSAPSSAYGVTLAGTWTPQVALPVSNPSPTPTHSPTTVNSPVPSTPAPGQVGREENGLLQDRSTPTVAPSATPSATSGSPILLVTPASSPIPQPISSPSPNAAPPSIPSPTAVSSGSTATTVNPQ